MSECLVCFTNNWVSNTPCSHNICIGCIFKLRKDECPMCRRQILYSLPEEIRQYLQLFRNQKKNNPSSLTNIDVNDIEEFPPL